MVPRHKLIGTPSHHELQPASVVVKGWEAEEAEMICFLGTKAMAIPKQLVCDTSTPKLQLRSETSHEMEGDLLLYCEIRTPERGDGRKGSKWPRPNSVQGGWAVPSSAYLATTVFSLTSCRLCREESGLFG